MTEDEESSPGSGETEEEDSSPHAASRARRMENVKKMDCFVTLAMTFFIRPPVTSKIYTPNLVYFHTNCPLRLLTGAFNLYILVFK
jgi:hypothetical protein